MVPKRQSAVSGRSPVLGGGSGGGGRMQWWGKGLRQQRTVDTTVPPRAGGGQHSAMGRWVLCLVKQIHAKDPEEFSGFLVYAFVPTLYGNWALIVILKELRGRT